MSTINDGGPAFPHKRQIRCNGEVIDSEMEPGMTLRDYFAVSIMQGLMAYYGGFCDQDAKAAYAAADAMLKAKEAKP